MPEECAACGHSNPGYGKFCPECGTAYASQTSRTESPVSPVQDSGSEVALEDAATLAGGPSSPVTDQAGSAASRSAGPKTPGSGATGLLVVGEAFGPRYHIIRLLGAGGMGAVYQAWDAELGVAVALKVIRPQQNNDPAVAEDMERRFKRELLLARQVTHANVVRIHDLGDINGIKYFTMTYVEGADLSKMLAKHGRLPLPQALAIAKQVAYGLRAAHQVGVVHRDLKPANVMVAGEDAFIMDFGIAHSVESKALATSAGNVVGTIAYMAPEQARGELVDHRADIYAFGLIFHAMLVGRSRTSSENSAMGDLMKRMQEGVPNVRTLDPQIPEGVARIVARCLEIDPKARYEKTGDLVADLSRLDANGQPLPVARHAPKLRGPFGAALAASLIVLASIAWWIGRKTAAPPPPPPPPVSALVANFDNRTGDPVFEGSLEQAFGLGLEGASFVTTFPRQSATQIVAQLAPGRPLDVESARLVSVREGIQVVLSGVIEPAGSGYHLSVRALEPADGRTVAEAESSAGSKEDVLKAVESLAKSIRVSLGDSPPEDDEARAKETFSAANLEAVKAYSQAQDLASSGKLEEAIVLYQKALALDPNFGRAYSGWATSAFRLGRRDEAEGLWKQALSFMDRMTERERLRTLGTYYLGISRNYEKAIENFAALIARYPADGAAVNNLGVAYFGALDFAKALQEGNRAVEIYPKNAFYRTNLALYAMYAGDFAAARKEAEQVTSETDAFPKAYLPLAMDALLSGNWEGAQSAYQSMAKGGGRGPTLASIGLADLALYEGRLKEAETILAQGIRADLEAKRPRDAAVKKIALAETFSLLGRRPQAIAAAQEALKDSQSDSVVVPAALLLVSAGRDAEARTLAKGLEGQIQKQSRAYAQLIEGEIALREGQTPAAVDALTAAKGLADLWQVRLALARAYVLAGQFPEALSELDTVRKRQGEATAVFLDDVPSARYLVPVDYWLARAQEGLGKKAEAGQDYAAFLARRGRAAGDPLAADARKRSASP